MLAGSEPKAGQHCLEVIPSTVQQALGNWASTCPGQLHTHTRHSNTTPLMTLSLDPRLPQKINLHTLSPRRPASLAPLNKRGIECVLKIVHSDGGDVSGRRQRETSVSYVCGWVRSSSEVCVLCLWLGSHPLIMPTVLFIFLCADWMLLGGIKQWSRVNHLTALSQAPKTGLQAPGETGSLPLIPGNVSTFSGLHMSRYTFLHDDNYRLKVR